MGVGLGFGELNTPPAKRATAAITTTAVPAAAKMGQRLRFVGGGWTGGCQGSGPGWDGPTGGWPGGGPWGGGYPGGWEEPG